jgi:hypothetical protein
MNSPFRGAERNRLSLRIPWMIEIESEGLLAVAGSLLVVGLMVVLVYF